MRTYVTVIYPHSPTRGEYMLGERPVTTGPITRFSQIQLDAMPDLQRTDSFFIVCIEETGDELKIVYMKTYKVFMDSEPNPAVADAITIGKIDPLFISNKIIDQHQRERRH